MLWLWALGCGERHCRSLLDERWLDVGLPIQPFVALGRVDAGLLAVGDEVWALGTASPEGWTWTTTATEANLIATEHGLVLTEAGDLLALDGDEFVPVSLPPLPDRWLSPEVAFVGDELWVWTGGSWDSEPAPSDEPTATAPYGREIGDADGRIWRRSGREWELEGQLDGPIRALAEGIALVRGDLWIRSEDGEWSPVPGLATNAVAVSGVVALLDDGSVCEPTVDGCGLVGRVPGDPVALDDHAALGTEGAIAESPVYAPLLCPKE